MNYIFPVPGLIAGVLLAALIQATPSPAPDTIPQLSTAERRAFAADEQQKKDAAEKYTQAQQDEVTMGQEFARNHPGWHINPATLAVEKDQAPPVKKP